MAKLTARGHHEVARWKAGEDVVYVLRSDGQLLSGFRRLRGGYDYRVLRALGTGPEALAKAERLTAALGAVRQ